MVEHYERELSDPSLTPGLSDKDRAEIKNGKFRQRSSNKYRFQVPTWIKNVPLLGNIAKGEEWLGEKFVNWIWAEDDQAEAQGLISPLKVKNQGAFDKKALEFLDNLKQRLPEFDSHDQWAKWAKSESVKFVNVAGAAVSVQGMTLTQLKAQQSNLQATKEYREGTLQMLFDNIDLAPTSLLGKENAKEQLQNYQKFTDKWNQAQATIINTQKFKLKVAQMGKQDYEQLELTMKMFPDGTVDYKNLFDQIQYQKDKGELTLRDFANALAKLYLETEAFSNLSLGDFAILLGHSLKNMPVDYSSSKLYFEQQYYGKDNVLTRAGYTTETYGNTSVAIDFLNNVKDMLPSLESKTIDIPIGVNEVIDFNKERGYFKNIYKQYYTFSNRTGVKKRKKRYHWFRNSVCAKLCDKPRGLCF